MQVLSGILIIILSIIVIIYSSEDLENRYVLAIISGLLGLFTGLLGLFTGTMFIVLAL